MCLLMISYHANCRLYKWLYTAITSTYRCYIPTLTVRMFFCATVHISHIAYRRHRLSFKTHLIIGGTKSLRILAAFFTTGLFLEALIVRKTVSLTARNLDTVLSLVKIMNRCDQDITCGYVSTFCEDGRVLHDP